MAKDGNEVPARWASTRGLPIRATTRTTISASSIRRSCMPRPCCFPTRRRWRRAARNTPTARAARRRPTRLPRPIDALEGSAGTILVPSGLAAVTIPLLAFVSAGDHLLIVDSVYHPTRNFADTMLKRLGVEVEYYDPACRRRHRRADQAQHQGGVHRIAGLQHVRDAGHPGDRQGGACGRRHRDDGQHLGDAALFPRRSTTASTSRSTRRRNIRPAIPTCCSARSRPMRAAGSSSARRFCTLGCCAGPDDVYQVLRGLRTMGVRLEHHQRSALAIARGSKASRAWRACSTLRCPAIPDHALVEARFLRLERHLFHRARRRRPEAAARFPRRAAGSSASAIPGAAMRALRCRSASATASSPKAPMKAR